MDYTHNLNKYRKYEDAEPIFLLHEYNIDVRSRQLYLMGEGGHTIGIGNEEMSEPGVEYVMTNRFIRNMNILMRTSDKPILIHMKTCGGDWQEGMAIHNLIEACPNMVTILNYTHARSMSSLIFCAADKRVMMQDSTFMFHEGTMGYKGSVKQYLTEADELVKSRERMLEIYIDVMEKKGKFKGQSSQKIKTWLKRQMDKKEEVYFSAEQAIEHGFADEVFGSDGIYDWEKLTKYPEPESEPESEVSEPEEIE